jgi:hypothetical protein
MHMKKTVQILKWPMMALILFIASCQENKDDVNPINEIKEETNLIVNVVKDHLAAKVAQNLAKNLSSIEVRNFVKEKALDRFDGDYNFLIGVTKNHQIRVSENGRTSSLSFGDIIAGTNSNSASRTTSSLLLDSLSTYYPLLQVAIPNLTNSNVENWQTESETPLVAFVPSDYETSHIIPAYDLDGNYYELDATKEPDQLTIVISENERLMVFKKESNVTNGRSAQDYPVIDQCPIMQEAYFDDDLNRYYLRSSVYNEINKCIIARLPSFPPRSPGGPGGGTGGSTITCDRDRKSGKDRLHRMIFNTMKNYRDVNEWFDGGQDIEVTIFFGQVNGAIVKVTKAFSGRDKNFKNCGIFKCYPEWFGLGNAEVVTWDKDIYGSAMLYSWVEKDGGSTVELNSSFSATFENDDGSKTTQTFSVKNTIQSQDDFMGESVVEYCDNTDGDGYTYNTGKIKFQVRQ